MVDLSHANSKKVAKNQLVNAVAVSTDANVDGVMAESYLFEGCSANSYGVSKTTSASVGRIRKNCWKFCPTAFKACQVILTECNFQAVQHCVALPFFV